MTTEALPLFSPTYKNADETVLRDEGAHQYNGFIDPLGGVNVRPGESGGYRVGVRVDGVFAWPEKPLVVAQNGYAQLYTASGKNLTPMGPNPLLSFPAGVPVVMCNNDTYTFMAGGGQINYIDALGILGVISDTEAPTRVTHIAFLDGYLLAVQGTKLYWSDVNNPLAWSALNFATAEGHPDSIQAMVVLQRQIYLIGTVTTEIWENDGSSPFSRIPGGFIQVGTTAKYSPVVLDNEIVWLSHNRYFVKFSGTDTQRISTPYDKEIQRFGTISDCRGVRIDLEGKTICLFNFPTEQRTLAFDVISGEWSEWGAWNDTAMSWEPYDITSAAYDVATGTNFIGKEVAQRIVALDYTSRIDYIAPTVTFQAGTAGDPVPGKAAEYQVLVDFTGFINTKFAAYSNLADALNDTYYDLKAQVYKVSDYLGGVTSYEPLLQRIHTAYYTDYVLANNGGIPGFWIFSDGFREDITRNTSRKTEALNAFSLLLAHGSFVNDLGSATDMPYAVPIDSDHGGARECAYMVLLYINAMRAGISLTPTQTARRDQGLNWLVDYCGQWSNETVDYCKVFFAGIVSRALIDYDTYVGPDTRIKPALIALWDYIWDNCWLPTDAAFKYADKDPGAPDDPSPWDGPQWDLSMLTVMPFGWLHVKDGDSRWRTRGDAIFQGAYPDYGPAYAYHNGVGAYLGTVADPNGKFFSQQLWSMPDYIYWAEQGSSESEVITENTRPVKFLKRTGNIDHGVLQKKRNEELRIRVKRGHPGSSAANPKLMFRYRNDGKSGWSSMKEINLGPVGDREIVVRLKRLGIYRTRQYELSVTDDAAVVLAHAEEDFTILR